MEGTGVSIIVSPSIISNYYARALSICDTTLCVSKTIAVYQISVQADSAIASLSVVCSGTSSMGNASSLICSLFAALTTVASVGTTVTSAGITVTSAGTTVMSEGATFSSALTFPNEMQSRRSKVRKRFKRTGMMICLSIMGRIIGAFCLISWPNCKIDSTRHGTQILV